MDIKLTNIFSWHYLVNQNFYNFSVDFNELIFYFSGSGEVTFGNNTYTYGPNMVFVSNAHDVRTQITLEYTDYICIRYMTQKKQDLCTPGIYKYEDSNITRLLLELKKEYDEKKFRYFDFCNYYIGQILISISRLQINNQPAVQNIYTVIENIDKNNGTVKSIKELAKECGYSYDHFRHKFKSITGQYPTNYILNRRLEKACNLLKSNKYSCTEVAMMCGFNSLSQFSTTFKKKMGTSPYNAKKLSSYTSDRDKNNLIPKIDT